MIIFATESEGRNRRRAVRMPDGADIARSDWMDTGQDQRFSPTVFLAQQPPACAVATHFHRHNEFQVIVHGGGMLGPHALRPIMVHYAGAYTGYGPLVAGPGGLHYFTLRAVYDPGPLYAVGNRDQLLRGPKVQCSSKPFAAGTPESLHSLQAAEIIDVLPLTADGGAAQLIRLPPRAIAASHAPSGSAGQFFMVIAGTMVQGGKVLNRRESLFLSPDEPPLQVTAGDTGAEVLLMQLPPMDPAYLPSTAA